MPYDLRSDTVTKPSDGMRKAMYDAEVGDDVYREDPTVNKLEEEAARLTGKKAGLFVTSGSMGNLIALYLNCGKGNEVIAHEASHIFHYELASAAALAGVMPAPIRGDRGIVTVEEAEKRIRPGIYYMPRTTLLEVENAHNSTYYRIEELEPVAKFAKKQGLKMHMDGARLFNAATAAGVPAKKIASYTDTVTFCLSKGLGAPVGSVLCGDKDFIDEARRIRKMLGGGMRQAGVLAAAGLYALEYNVDRLAEDHAHARKLAEALHATTWATIDPKKVETNILFFDTPGVPASTIVDALKKQGVLCSATGPESIRLVTHLDISKKDVDAVCGIIASLNPKVKR